jgi:hypothetical protein
MKAKLTQINEKAQVKLLLVLGTGAMSALVAASGVVSQGPGRP